MVTATDPLRIAILGRPWIEVPPRGHGGVERVCAILIDELVRRGHDVTLIGVGRNGTAATFHATYPTPQIRHGVSLIPELAHAARARQVLAAGSFDIVHDHTLIGPLLGEFIDTPTLSTVHDPVIGDETSDKYTLLGDYYAALGDRANLVAISRAQRADRPE
ncbi:MAG: glycosyltransferase, partial [Mycobacteriales bacterium]